MGPKGSFNANKEEEAKEGLERRGKMDVVLVSKDLFFSVAKEDLVFSEL